MKVRSYLPSDRGAVTALAERLLVGMAPWNDPVDSRTAVRRWVDDALERVGADHPVFVAAIGDEVVGFVTVAQSRHFTGRAEAHVGELAVAESVERSGAGRALMAAAEDWARSQGLARLSLETGAANNGARAFYAAMGYGEEEVRVSKPLSQDMTPATLAPCSRGWSGL